MSKRNTIAAGIAATALLSAFAGGKARASIVYGDFTGSQFQYLQVTEGSSTTSTALYGSPTISGNSLVFNPTSFGASASNGGLQLTAGTLTTTIKALPGSAIHQIRFSESGTYTLTGGTPSTGTNVSVAAPVYFQIIQINGVGVNPIGVNANAVFTPNNGSYNLLSNAGTDVAWTGSLSESLDQAIANAGLTGSATEVIYSLGNDLTAISQSGTTATITKDSSDGVSITATVPEPASVGLFAVATLGLLKRRARS